MSEQVQLILEAVQSLNPSQREELTVALASMNMSTAFESESERSQLVQSIRGKYRHVATSVEAFLDRKHSEIDLESRM